MLFFPCMKWLSTGSQQWREIKHSRCESLVLEVFLITESCSPTKLHRFPRAPSSVRRSLIHLQITLLVSKYALDPITVGPKENRIVLFSVPSLVLPSCLVVWAKSVGELGTCQTTRTQIGIEGLGVVR